MIGNHQRKTLYLAHFHSHNRHYLYAHTIALLLALRLIAVCFRLCVCVVFFVVALVCSVLRKYDVHDNSVGYTQALASVYFFLVCLSFSLSLSRAHKKRQTQTHSAHTAHTRCRVNESRKCVAGDRAAAAVAAHVIAIFSFIGLYQTAHLSILTFQ